MKISLFFYKKFLCRGTFFVNRGFQFGIDNCLVSLYLSPHVL